MRIAVNPVFQRNKIGSALIQHITHYAQNQSKIVLEVADNNTQAIAFYTSLGFYRVGVRKNYYHLNSAILMEKIIDHED
jgi:ribosomal-protein-alanine N-acetyltransferase